MVLLEAAVESLAGGRRAVADGARRLELCANLAVGGVTPSLALLRAVRSAVDVPLHVLVRPRGGDFVYTRDEVETMRASVRLLRDAGADGAVLGALDREGRVDRAVIEALRDDARGLPLAGHRAVDEARDLEEAIETLAALGIARALTSGGAATADEGRERLARLVRRFAGRVTILAGGGVRAGNVARIVAESGVSEVHVGFPDGAEDDRIRAIAAAVSFPRK